MAAAGQRHSLGLRNDFAQRPDALRRKEQAAAANNMLRLPRIRLSPGCRVSRCVAVCRETCRVCRETRCRVS